MKGRYPEIDALRGAAIIGMVVYHLLVDLQMFYGFEIGVFELPGVMFARIVGMVFVTLLGMGAEFQYQKEKKVFNIFKRGGKLLILAMGISLVTYLFFPDEYVRFGILHLLGVSLWLLIPLLSVKSNILFLLGLLIIIFGNIFKINTPPALDYYPLLPWFGVVVWGVILGRIYKPGIINIRSRILEYFGKRSLIIYLVHQPLLLLGLYLVDRFCK